MIEGAIEAMIEDFSKEIEKDAKKVDESVVE